MRNKIKEKKGINEEQNKGKKRGLMRNKIKGKKGIKEEREKRG